MIKNLVEPQILSDFCPYCGSEVYIDQIYRETKTQNLDWYRVGCLNSKQECPFANLQTEEYGTRRTAIRAWNLLFTKTNAASNK